MASNQTTHQRILDAALEVFLEHGWQSSLDIIAERAGVARQTLYNHFPSKEVLFAEAGKTCSAALAITLEEGQGSLRDRLIAFSRAFRAKVMSQQGLAMCRMMIAEAPRFPELTKMMFDAGPGATREQLAAVLSQAMKKNELKKEDSDFAAEILLALLGGFSRTEKLCTQFTETETQNEQEVQRIVDVFLRAFT